MDIMRYREKKISALERIADALEAKVVTETVGTRLAETMVSLVSGLLKSTKTRPPTIGDVVDEPTDEEVAIAEEEVRVFDENVPYDPSDDTTCPNCSQGEGVPVVDHGGPTGALMCDQCHHVWVPGVE